MTLALNEINPRCLAILGFVEALDTLDASPTRLSHCTSLGAAWDDPEAQHDSFLKSFEPHGARDVVQILQALDGEYGQSCNRCDIAPSFGKLVTLAVGVTKDVTAVVTSAHEILFAVLPTWPEPVI